MTFQPVLPMSGYGGWKFLTRTLASQQESFNAAPRIERDTAYFREKIASVNSAEDLVADRRLLRVALGAFGLSGDIDNRYFVRKVLEEGTVDRRSLANRLSDRRYFEFSRAFGFGDPGVPPTSHRPFGERIVSAYQDRRFEVAVGEQSETMRLALGARRELPELAAHDAREDTLWLSVMGKPPLRKVFETAFGLPGSFGALDLDLQVEKLRAYSRRTLGDDSIAQFRAPERVEALVQQFVVRDQMNAGPPANTPGSVALQLLQGAQGGGASAGLLNIIR